jgi:hypothetical protein
MMSFKELAVSMQSDMIAQSKAHQRIEERKRIAMNDADVDDDRHDSDAEEFRNESKREEFDAMSDAGMSMGDFL